MLTQTNYWRLAADVPETYSRLSASGHPKVSPPKKVTYLNMQDGLMILEYCRWKWWEGGSPITVPVNLEGSNSRGSRFHPTSCNDLWLYMHAKSHMNCWGSFSFCTSHLLVMQMLIIHYHKKAEQEVVSEKLASGAQHASTGKQWKKTDGRKVPSAGKVKKQSLVIVGDTK